MSQLVLVSFWLWNHLVSVSKRPCLEYPFMLAQTQSRPDFLKEKKIRFLSSHPRLVTALASSPRPLFTSRDKNRAKHVMWTRCDTFQNLLRKAVNSFVTWLLYHELKEMVVMLRPRDNLQPCLGRRNCMSSETMGHLQLCLWQQN